MLRLAALLMLSALPAAAAPVAFSTVRAFRAVAGATFTETFNRCGRATAVFSGPLSAAGNEACAAGAIRPGVSFSDDPGPFGHQLYLAAPRYAANRSTALGQNDPATDALHIRFDAPVRALGFSLFQNVGGGASLARALPVTVTLFDAADTEIARFKVPVGPRSAFFGVIDEDWSISRASINNPLSYDLIDDVRFTRPLLRGSLPTLNADLLATPEPAALGLFGFALALLEVRSRAR